MGRAARVCAAVCASSNRELVPVLVDEHDGERKDGRVAHQVVHRLDGGVGAVQRARHARPQPRRQAARTRAHTGRAGWGRRARRSAVTTHSRRTGAADARAAARAGVRHSPGRRVRDRLLAGHGGGAQGVGARGTTAGCGGQGPGLCARDHVFLGLARTRGTAAQSSRACPSPRAEGCRVCFPHSRVAASPRARAPRPCFREPPTPLPSRAAAPAAAATAVRPPPPPPPP